MTKHDFLKLTLTRLAKLQIHSNKQGGPSENGQLFEQILEIQDRILKSFGLPCSPDHAKLLRFNSDPTELELKKKINQLCDAATNYLLRNAKSDFEVLLEAQENQRDPMYVLPELKIETHVYTIFVINKILLTGKDSIGNILQDLRFCNQPEILNALGKIYFGTTGHDHELIGFLENIGVRYLQQFIMHNSDLLTNDDY
jgi:hypothetical protein